MNEEIFATGSNEISWPTDMVIGEGERAKEFRGKVLFINVDTLIRNAIAAFEGKVHEYDKSIRDRIDTDITIMRQYFQNDCECEVLTYRVLYDNLLSDSQVKRKEFKTDKQKLARGRYLKAIEVTKDFVDVEFTSYFKNIDQMKYRDAYIITHMAVDLLKFNTFNTLTLLESFTGDVKESAHFNRKLNIAKELREYIPFNRIMLVVFGDNELFAKQSKELTERIIGIAKKYNWNRITTENRVLFAIQQEDNMLHGVLTRMAK